MRSTFYQLVFDKKHTEETTKQCILPQCLVQPHDIIHPPFWRLAGITGANGSSWN